MAKQPRARASARKPNGVTYALQCLTYMFWGWLSLSLIWLIALVVHWFIGGSKSDYGEVEMIAYPLTATGILLAIALATDYIYSKVESRVKVGAESVIMVANTVVTSLAAVAALIVAAFVGVSILLDDGGGSITDKQIPLVTAVLMFFVFMLLVVRTIKPCIVPKYRLYYRVKMAAIVLIGAAIVLAGPFAYAMATKTDRLIEAGLPEVADTISRYYNDNQTMPEKLRDLDLDTAGAAKKIVDRNLVEYIVQNPVKETPAKDKRSIGPYTIELPIGKAGTAHEYQLCVKYAKEKERRWGYSKDVVSDAESNERRTGVNTDAHKAGRVCYNLVTSQNWEIKNPINREPSESEPGTNMPVR